MQKQPTVVFANQRSYTPTSGKILILIIICFIFLGSKKSTKKDPQSGHFHRISGLLFWPKNLIFFLKKSLLYCDFQYFWTGCRQNHGGWKPGFRLPYDNMIQGESISPACTAGAGCKSTTNASPSGTPVLL